MLSARDRATLLRRFTTSGASAPKGSYVKPLDDVSDPNQVPWMPMTLTRRRFLRDGTYAALAFPVGWLLQTEAHPGPQPLPHGLEMLPREAWSDDRPTGRLEVEEVRFLLVHHTASGNEYEPGDVPGLLRGFFSFHTGPDKGWPDIAYNFLIDRFGRVWEGRDGSLEGPVAGSATGGNQGYSHLVAVIGDFSETMPTPEALEALRRTLAWLADRYDVDTSPGAATHFTSRGSNLWSEGTRVDTATIAGHRDMSLTECPGDTFYEYVTDGLAGDVTALRSQTTTTTTTTNPSTTTLQPPSQNTTSTTTTGVTETSPMSTRGPLSTDQVEAVSSTEASANSVGSDTPSGGLQVIGVAAAAILFGLLSLIRRRIRNERRQ